MLQVLARRLLDVVIRGLLPDLAHDVLSGAHLALRVFPRFVPSLVSYNLPLFFYALYLLALRALLIITLFSNLLKVPSKVKTVQYPLPRCVVIL